MGFLTKSGDLGPNIYGGPQGHYTNITYLFQTSKGIGRK